MDLYQDHDWKWVEDNLRYKMILEKDRESNWDLKIWTLFLIILHISSKLTLKFDFFFSFDKKHFFENRVYFRTYFNCFHLFLGSYFKK